MKKFYFCGVLAACSFVVWSSSSLRAQTAAPVATTLDSSLPAARAPLAQHLEGTVEVVGFGRTQRADVKFSSPDSLFVHIQGDARQNVPDEIYIARGATQTTYNADSRRVRRWNWSSAQQPWRSQALADGGPANMVLWGWNPQSAAKFYNLKTVKNSELTTVTMTAKNGRRNVYDAQRSGGRGDRVVFAVFKRAVYDWPRVVILQFDASGKIVSQERRDERNRVLDKTTFAWNGDFPASATTRDANNVTVSRWNYVFKAAAKAHDATTFDLNVATGNASVNQLVEDAELLPIANYRERAAKAAGTARATVLLNLGVAHLRHTEDMTAARNALQSAATLAPQAVAPQLQILDLSLQTRDTARAQKSLEALTKLLGADDIAVLERRAQLAISGRDWNAAQSAYESIIAARPDASSTSSTRLQLARLQMLRGDVTNARQTLAAILAIEPTFGNAPTEANALFTTSQSASQASAARLWAYSFSDDAAKTSAANAPQKTPAQLLARALLLLNTGAAPAFSTTNATFLQTWGEALALSGKTAEATAAFSTLATRGDVRSSTRSHRALMVLNAMSGNTANSLRSFWMVSRRDADEEARAFTRSTLFNAWRRVGRGDALKRALEARSMAPDSTEDDARLWLAWQENHGSPEAIGATVRNFAAKYRDVAWWQSRLAEQLSNEAEPLKKDPQGRGIKLTREAIAAVERAISLDKPQSFYAVQRAFILTFRANDLRKAGVSDATATVEAVNTAQIALDELRRTRASDPEVSISVAAAQQALSTKDNGAITDFTRGLEGGLPGRSSASSERHNTAFAARQALAIALRRQQKWQEAAAQYDILMASAQSASEEVGIALNYQVLLRLNAGDDTKSLAAGASQLLKRLSVEPWPLDDADGATRAFVSILQNDSKLWPAVVSILRRETDSSSRLALGYLAFSIQNALTSMAAQPDNSEETTAYLNTVLKQIEPVADAAEANLVAVAQGDDALLSSRAHWLLAQRDSSRNEYSNLTTHLRAVVAREPEFVEARLGLVRALMAQNQNDAARDALDTTEQTLPPSAATLQNVADLRAQIGDKSGAHRVLEAAWHEAQFDNATSTQTAQRTAYRLARVRIADGKTTEAAALYERLSDASWTRLERAAALLDWENGLRAADKTADANAIKTRRDALKLSPIELQRVQEFVKAL